MTTPEHLTAIVADAIKRVTGSSAYADAIAGNLVTTNDEIRQAADDYANGRITMDYLVMLITIILIDKLIERLRDGDATD